MLPVKPLDGARIVVTRSREQAGELTSKILNLGGEVVHFPVLSITEPRDPVQIFEIERALERIEEYDWLLFTSVNGVAYFMKQLERLQIAVSRIRARIAAVGPKTAESLLHYGLVAQIPPHFYQAEGLFEAIQPELRAGEKVLIPTSKLARDYLQNEMSKMGIEVTRIHIYENQLNIEDGTELIALLQAKEIDMITLTSSSTASNLLTALHSLGVAEPLALLEGIDIVCIGLKTAETVRELGILDPKIAEQATTDSLVQRLIELHNNRSTI